MERTSRMPDVLKRTLLCASVRYCSCWNLSARSEGENFLHHRLPASAHLLPLNPVVVVVVVVVVMVVVMVVVVVMVWWWWYQQQPQQQQQWRTCSLDDFGGMYSKNDMQHYNFEPRLVKRDPDEIAHKMVAAKEVVRPRYYSSELSIKSKLVVAIVSKLSVMKQYGLTWNLTIHEHVDHLVFFITEEPPPSLNGLPIISFPDWKKGHLMNNVLTHLHEHYSTSYEFFLLMSAMSLTEVPYINSLALHRALMSVSTSRPMHYGVPAAKGAHYCKLGDGIVLSSSVVSSVAASSAWCRTHTSPTATEDANFGRCIMHATALPCASQVQEKLYRSVTLNTLRDKAHGHSVLTQLQSAVLDNTSSPPVVPYTVTGLSQPHHLLAVHQYFLRGEVVITKGALSEVRGVIMQTREKAPLKSSEVTWPLGSRPRNRPATRYDVVPWITFNSSHVYMPNDHCNSAPLSGALLEDVTSVVLAGSSHITNVSNGRLLLQKLDYGHYRVDPVRGTDYILSLTFRDGASGSVVTKIVEGSRGIVNTEFIPMPFVNENTKLTLLVPVSVLFIEQALGFIDRFIKNRSVWPNCSVLLVLLLPPSSNKKTNAFKPVIDAASEASGADGFLKTVSVMTSAESSHMAELAVMDQVVRKVSSGSLVFVVPSTATFTNEVLNRVRMNTIQGWQFFSPVMYGLYHPSVVDDATSAAYINRDIKSTLGHYLRYDFSAISFYMSDYVAARKQSSRLFPILGTTSGRVRGDHVTQQQCRKYSISLYRLLVSYSSCHALRAPEPFLRMPYDEEECCSTRKYDSIETRDTNTKSLSVESNPARKSNFVRKNERPKSDSVSDVHVAPRLPVNRLLSDVSLLLGDSREDNDAAFYHYVTDNLLSQLQPSFRNNTLNDFRGDGLCYEKRLDSFGTRVQLSKLLMEYDDKYGSLSN
ncbi:Chondroitin N-acetylgalactosaminyltransferase [Trinorchestia longiramus]|nr:Chondroitin N-acetylgalactosaminyltransferase [Trinorchestia longiramus]